MISFRDVVKVKTKLKMSLANSFWWHNGVDILYGKNGYYLFVNVNKQYTGNVDLPNKIDNVDIAY